MINLRVDDCAGLLAALRAKGVAVLGEADEGYGKFAWLSDPDGVRFESWEGVADQLRVGNVLASGHIPRLLKIIA